MVELVKTQASRIRESHWKRLHHHLQIS